MVTPRPAATRLMAAMMREASSTTRGTKSDLAFISTVSYFGRVLAVAPGFEPRDLRQTTAYGRANPRRLRALAIATKERFPLLPEAPTAEESGLPGYVMRSWNGISAPASTPPAIVERLSGAVGAVMAHPELRGRLQDLGVSPGANSPAEFKAFFAAEARRWSAVIDEARIERQ